MQIASPSQIITEAFKAAEAAGLAQFERDGRRDRGACGGFILKVDGGGHVGKALIAEGKGRQARGGVIVRIPDGNCPSQHGAIKAEAGRAACEVFERHGVRVVEARSYVD